MRKRKIEVVNIVPRLCAYCSKQLEPSHASRVYCSDVCRLSARKDRQHEYYLGYSKNYEQHKLPKIEKRKCASCGKPTHDFRCAECWRKIRAENGIFESEISHAV